MLHWPFTSRWTVMFWQITVGFVLSTTVTVALQVELLPLGSVVVRVTMLLPPLLQSKLVLLAERLTPQASVLPPSISAGAMVAWPVASRLTVMSLHLASGLATSLTVDRKSVVEGKRVDLGGRSVIKK